MIVHHLGDNYMQVHREPITISSGISSGGGEIRETKETVTHRFHKTQVY